MAAISCFIISKNEEKRIALAINSVKKFVDEVIVVDSGSSDRTTQISSNLGARVVFNEWCGYVKQKAFAESLCKHDWVLNIDADEELSLDLQNEIASIFESDSQDRYLAYRINFVILHPLDKLPRLWAPDNKFIRIYNKNFCSFANTTQTTTHDAVLFNDGVSEDGKIYDLNEVAYHRSATSISQLVAKANFYSTEQAKDFIAIGRKISKLRIFFEMFVWFFKVFFIRRYFVFGFDGFVYSVVLAFARFMRMAKVYEMIQNEKESKELDSKVV